MILTKGITEKIKSHMDTIKTFDPDAVSFENDTCSINKKYKIGHIFVNRGNFYIRSEFDNKDILIEKDDLLGADENDFVVARVIFNPRGKIKAKVVLIIEKGKNKNLVIYQNNHFISVKNNNKIESQNIKNPQNGDLYIIEEGLAQWFGNINDAKIDEKISLYLFKEEYRLDKYEISNPNTKISFEDRIDLTELNFCTIDPVGAKDHDDSIFYDYQNEILYVAIADVSHYIKEGSEIDKEARKRAFSVYFPNKVLPMLPFVLSSDLCSLKPNVKRYSFVCKIYLDSKNLEVKKSEFFEAVIESKNNFSYEVIDDKISKKELSSDLQFLLELTQNLRDKRLKNGYNFRNNEHRLVLSKDEKLIEVLSTNSTLSHQLVEECMLLANQEAAKRIGNFGIFRIHEEPDIKKIDKLIEDLSLLGLDIKKKKDIHATITHIQNEASRFFLEKEVDTMVIKAQQQAKYSSHLGSHFGLGFGYYSHFTSPIRRYADLILHRILKGLKIPKDIDNICENISNTEREIAKMVWDLEERKYARWAINNLNKKTLKANICDVGDVVIGELIEEILGLKFEIKNYKGEKLYNKINVVLIEADLVSKKIYGNIIR